MIAYCRNRFTVMLRRDNYLGCAIVVVGKPGHRISSVASFIIGELDVLIGFFTGIGRIGPVAGIGHVGIVVGSTPRKREHDAYDNYYKYRRK